MEERRRGSAAVVHVAPLAQRAKQEMLAEMPLVAFVPLVLIAISNRLVRNAEGECLSLPTRLVRRAPHSNSLTLSGITRYGGP